MKLPQLHLRDLFWLVLVVAVGFVWWIDHRHWVSAVKNAQDERDNAVSVASRLLKNNKILADALIEEREKAK